MVGVQVTLTYSEDETSSGAGCAAPGASQPDPDTITGTITHDEYNVTESGQNQGQGSSSHTLNVEWFNSTLFFTGNATNMSESEIKNELDSMGAGLGLYFLEINVEAESNDGIGCSHTDNGEEVEYLVEVMLLDYKITPA